MAKQITHISVFLASPSDLSEERIAVKQAIDELNGMVRQMMNVHLDLLTWETDSYPSAGIDAQDVINTQIGSDYDIFIGMMWQKFGTPTGRAGSGTEEEFEIAYNKFVETGGRTKIMIYFSSKAIKPDDIDIEQIAKVKAFKNRVQERGILYGSFTDAESLQTILKMHLTKHLPSIVNPPYSSVEAKANGPENSADIKSRDIKEDDADDENGYFDLMEIFSENFSEVEKVLGKISEHIEDLGVQMNKKAARIDALHKAPNRSAQSFRILIDSSAADIMNYVNLTNVELPRFHDLFISAIDAFSTALTISEASGSNMEIADLEELLESIVSAKHNVEFATSSIIGFRETANSFPPVAKSINKAARLLRSTLSNLISELTNSSMLLDGLSELVNSILLRTNEGESLAEEV